MLTSLSIRKSLKLTLCVVVAMCSVGCTTSPGMKSSIWPTRKMGGENTPNTGVAGTLASTTKAVKGQFSSMGTAVSSAYGKAKTAITSPFSSPTSTPSTDAATTTLSKSNSIGPEVYVMTGQLNESKGEYAKALDSYSKALEVDPKSISAMLSMARLYDRQNESEKSISFYNKAIEIAPNSGASYAELGAVYVKAGNLNAAKDQLQKAVNLEPKNANHRSAMAGVLLDMGNTEGALSELTQVHSPAMANYQMAYLHFSRKNVPATQQYLTNALQIDPNLKPARDLMASMGGAQAIQNVAQQGNQYLNQAQNVFQQASSINSNIQGLWQPNGPSPAAPGEPSTLPALNLPPVPQNAVNPSGTISR